LTPVQIAQLYNFPKGDGAGQTIALIELGGGYKEEDLLAYFKQLGITTPPNVSSIGVLGATGGPTDEVVLDLDIVAAIVPKALIRIYFASNTWDGFYEAIKKAITDKVNVIAISWGAPEKTWGSVLLQKFKAVDAGITVTATAGDNGASDGQRGKSLRPLMWRN
jgi:kumamolisin